MSKYDPLWREIRTGNAESLTLGFDEIEQILGFPVDHSFLSFKKELTAYGYTVVKISMKEKTIEFEKRKDEKL